MKGEERTTQGTGRGISTVVLVLILVLGIGLASGEAAGTPRQPVGVAAAKGETYRYLRPNSAGFAAESEIRLDKDAEGLRVRSATGRGSSELRLDARFDTERRLVEATVTVGAEGSRKLVRVLMREARARVERERAPVRELDCPPGVLVTSAPDWTDAFLMVSRYDRARGGRQEFPGLWVHPVQEPQRATFAITRLGVDTVERDGQVRRLERCRIELRGGSRYLAWGNQEGVLVRLFPEGQPAQGIVLTGWEYTLEMLKP